MRREQWLGLFLVVLLTAALMACARPATPVATPTPTPRATPAATPTPTPESEWDKVVKAAKAEGKIVFYDAFWAMSPRERETIFAAFEKATGIKVEVTAMQPADSRERIRTEQTSRQYVADIFASAISMPYDVWKQGFTQPAIVPAGQEKGMWRWDPYALGKTEGHVVLTHWTPGGVNLINTNLVKPEDEPKKWDDYLDPKYKGKLVMSDPRTPGSQLWWAALLERKGKDYWPKLAKNEPVLVPGISVPIERVTRGENAIGVGAEVKQSILAMKAGAPLKGIHFPEAVQAMPFGVAIPNGAPHVNAAKVLLNWLLTKEGQIVLSQAGNNSSLRNDIPQDWLPEIAQFKEGYNYLWITEPILEAARRDTMEYAKEVFAR